MKKRALSLLLILALAVGLLPLGASAQNGGDSTEYQQIMVSEADFDLYTKSDYPWTGSGTYTSGNAGGRTSLCDRVFTTFRFLKI